jgi:hypothetical protein
VKVTSTISSSVDAAAAGAQHVPGQLEQPETRGMQEHRDGVLDVDPGLGGEIEDVDAAERAVRPVLHQPLHRRHGLAVGQLPEGRK